MKWQMKPEWWKVWRWNLPWHHSDLSTDYGIYSHFAGLGPWQFHWWASGPKLLDK
jgi:hypothetical protein